MTIFMISLYIHDARSLTCDGISSHAVTYLIVFQLYSWQDSVVSLQTYRIGGIIVSLLSSSMVDRGIQHWLC